MKNFRKAIISAVCILAVLAVPALPVMAEDSDIPMIHYADEVGDVNADGLVNAADASRVLSYYSYLSTGGEFDLDQWQLNIADVDRNSRVDANDATCILRYYSYRSTTSDEVPVSNIRDFLVPPPPEAPVAAPEGLPAGTKGTIEYLVNTEPLNPHDAYPLFNVKADNKVNDGKPYISRYYYVTEEDKTIMRRFAAEHFTDDMTNYDRLKFTWDLLHHNVVYADGRDGRPQYSEIWNDSFVKACFEKKAGQCIQYNGAFAEMMAYMGYDTYLIEMWNSSDPSTIFSNQHFRSEAVIGGVGYSTEVGNVKEDSPKYNYKWMWLYDKTKLVLDTAVKAELEAAAARE